jgi:Peptidase family S41
MPADGRIFVLISRATFSAALVTAAMLKGNGGGRVIFVGETMGDNSRFWAETGTMTLPNSRISVTYSKSFEDWGAGCTDVASCYWPAVALGVKDISLAPDVTVTTSFSDYAAGRDAVLETALAMAT